MPFNESSDTGARLIGLYEYVDLSVFYRWPEQPTPHTRRTLRCYYIYIHSRVLCALWESVCFVLRAYLVLFVENIVMSSQGWESGREICSTVGCEL